MATIVRQSESFHWYLKDGTPFYEVDNKSKGGMRTATLRDARKVGAVPSFSVIERTIAKPGLQSWKLGQMLLAALTLPRGEDEPLDKFAERVVEDHEQHAEQARQYGTDLHAALQAYYSGEPYDEKFTLSVMAVQDAVQNAFPFVSDWVTEKSFANPLGFGGKVDMYSPIHRIVVDFKSKAFDADDIKKGLAYDENIRQLACYAMGLELEQPRVANVFVSTTVDGLAHVHPWSDQERREALDAFLTTHKLWMILNKYNPSSK